MKETHTVIFETTIQIKFNVLKSHHPEEIDAKCIACNAIEENGSLDIFLRKDSAMNWLDDNGIIGPFTSYETKMVGRDTNPA